MRMIKKNFTRFWINVLHSILICCTFCLICGTGLTASTLENRNPFLPRDYGEKNNSETTPKPQPSGTINKLVEFRGFYTSANITQFSLYNKRENKGYWISQNQSEGGISVSSFDVRSRSVTISMNGRTERLTLKSATGTPLPVVSSYNEPANQVKSPPAGGNVNQKQPATRNVVPRRRVILPQK